MRGLAGVVTLEEAMLGAAPHTGQGKRGMGEGDPWGFGLEGRGGPRVVLYHIIRFVYVTRTLIGRVAGEPSYLNQFFSS